MNISKAKLLQRMEKELVKAKVQMDNRETFLRSIANIQLLCELMLDDESTSSEQSMLLEQQPIVGMELKEKTKDIKENDTGFEHNPSSIFDF